MEKKILLLCVSSQSVINFRKTLIKKLQAENYSVSVVAFDEDYKKDVQDLGVAFYCIQDKNRGLNPLKILSLKSKYYKLIKDISPDIVFSFMLKPNTFGVMGAKKAGVKKIFSMVEGAGDVFIKNTLKWKVIRFVVCLLYKQAFKSSNKVFFLNNDDKNEFVNRKLIKEEQGEIIHGIGVDLVFLCGHYEGIDERVLEEIVTDYVSIGDYVLTGGELPSMVMIDAISRFVPGVLSNEESAQFESFQDNLLEYPQYSRPAEWMGKKVPDVLLSGHHANVEKWRREQSILRTLLRRPELLEDAQLSKKEKQYLAKLQQELAKELETNEVF